MSEQVPPEIEVRFEEHHGGGSVWFKVQNRLDYADEWLCVWSTDSGRRGRRVSVMDAAFLAATVRGTAIPVPYSVTPPAHAEVEPEEVT